MKTLSVTEVARNFSAVIDSVERDQQEIVLVRNNRHVARLVPEAPHQDAMTVFGDLYRTLDDETADALSAAVSPRRKRVLIFTSWRAQETADVLWARTSGIHRTGRLDRGRSADAGVSTG